ncbi:hypothetical protein CspeluHIS016_0602350 [Cutaneotrichosporon spelunceum]|uniref:Uncharacterized protein n=1 Tax=Cutaneotrichosporon spelunceum TaxID=1672016 RepID=A0AAD3YE51_9TREE|nr:hypothetical protein CspeluHIS016_0602350 [Cutaneotrichosporon spelunceum]
MEEEEDGGDEDSELKTTPRPAASKPKTTSCRSPQAEASDGDQEAKASSDVQDLTPSGNSAEGSPGQDVDSEPEADEGESDEETRKTPPLSICQSPGKQPLPWSPVGLSRSATASNPDDEDDPFDDTGKAQYVWQLEPATTKTILVLKCTPKTSTPSAKALAKPTPKPRRKMQARSQSVVTAVCRAPKPEVVLCK